MLLITEFLKGLGIASCYAAVFLLINNAVEPMHSGTVNGVAQSFASVARAVGPLTGGLVFAITASSPWPFPLNWYFSFIVPSLIMFGAYQIACNLPKTLDVGQQPTTD